jgi:acyl-CoA thioester hydrolase
MTSFPSHSSRARGSTELPFPRFILETDAMPREDFACAHRLRVRWAEVDMQKIVFNGHYLTSLDTAITEYWRAIGVPYPSGFFEHAIDTVVVRAALEYRAAARFDDELLIAVRVARLGRTSLGVAVEIARGGETLVTGDIVYVIVTQGEHRPTPAPAWLIERILAFETTAPERK